VISATSLVFLIGIFLSAPSWAQEAEAPAENAASDYKVKMDVKEQRLVFGLYGQMSQFEREGLNLTGYNLEGIVNYAITERIAAQLALAQSLDLANGLTVLFTGIRVGGAYSVWGSFVEKIQSLRVNNDDALTVDPPETSMLVVDAGIDQYMFNGVDRIVPATGASLGVRYDKPVFGIRGSLMARYGMLVISEDPVMMLTIGAGILVRF
jgi:hypothetical protein